MVTELEIELARDILAERRRQAAADHAATAAARAHSFTPSLLQLALRLLNGEPTRVPTGRRPAMRLQSQLTQ